MEAYLCYVTIYSFWKADFINDHFFSSVCLTSQLAKIFLTASSRGGRWRRWRPASPSADVTGAVQQPARGSKLLANSRFSSFTSVLSPLTIQGLLGVTEEPIFATRTCLTANNMIVIYAVLCCLPSKQLVYPLVPIIYILLPKTTHFFREFLNKYYVLDSSV